MDFDVLEVSNKLRQNPKSFIPILEKMIPKFEGLIYDNNMIIKIKTSEGAKAV